MKLLGVAWMGTLASMGMQLLALFAALMLVGKASGASAERAAFVLVAVDLLIAVGCVVWFAQRSAVAGGQLRYGWVALFGFSQLALLALAAFISLVAMNR
ncbi:MAG: hypothetical protein IPO66_10955 [Rhodanobacteraceae bacterium]|nr:hypothetical protein [Rhodanobacteraceae bacterium]